MTVIISLFTVQTLKKNWDKLHHDYQGLSLVTDTLSKKSHKQRLEVSMDQLQKDINRLERFQTVYVAKTT